MASIMATAAWPARRHEREVAVLDGLDPALELLVAVRVAGGAGAVGREERAADPVLGDLLGALALVGHVAVGAGHAARGVDALAPHLELGVLGLEDLHAGLGVGPVLEALPLHLHAVVEVLHLLDLQPLGPREEDGRALAAEVLDVALAADVGAHLLAGPVDVGIVGAGAVALAPALDAGQVRGIGAVEAASFWMPVMKAGRVTRSSIGLGVVAVDAGDRVGLAAGELLEQLVGVPVAHVADRREPLLDLLGLGRLGQRPPSRASGRAA